MVTCWCHRIQQRPYALPPGTAKCAQSCPCRWPSGEVNDFKVVILDEASTWVPSSTLHPSFTYVWKYYHVHRASIDLETDNCKIQHTIQTEFRDCTLLCIARAYTTFWFFLQALMWSFRSITHHHLIGPCPCDGRWLYSCKLLLLHCTHCVAKSLPCFHKSSIPRERVVPRGVWQE